jgi:RNA polymerase sigma-54 factor
MSLKLTTSLSQRLVLTPQLRQRIEMLQMTSLELTDLIQQQLLENPVLEEVPSQEEVQEIAEKVLDHLASSERDTFEERAPEPGTTATNGAGDPDVLSAVPASADGEPGEAVASGEPEEGGAEEGTTDEAQRDSFEEIDFGREFQDYLDPGYKTQEIEYKEDAPTFEQFLTKPPSLAEHLEWQLNMTTLEDDIRDAAVCVIGNLNADGRFNATDEEIAEVEKIPVEVIERARQVVMRLDPVGCGARDVKECLLVQLEVLGETDRLAAKLISEHFADLQQHKLPHLSKQIGIDVETLLEELQFIRTLDPYPGRRYSSEEPILISPEIYIEKLDENDEEYVIYFADDGSPRLRVSQQYQQMLSQESATRPRALFARRCVRQWICCGISNTGARRFTRWSSRSWRGRKTFWITGCNISSR